MKVAIRDIPAMGLNLHVEENGDELQAAAGKVDFRILSPVSADFTLLKTDREVFIRGVLTSSVKLQCARCLKEFEHKISSRIENIYVLTSGQGKKEKEHEITSEDININYLTGNEIDINALLLEQLSLDIPMQLVCRPDCKGLCPKCGADLNQARCGCLLEEHVDSKFAKLKELKPKD